MVVITVSNSEKKKKTKHKRLRFGIETWFVI